MATGVHTMRVRYAESDQMGVAHHASYVVWFEEARIEFLRSLGHSYRELEAAGLCMPVIDLAVRYKRILRFDDQLTLTTTATVAGPTRLVFHTTITHADHVCAEADVKVAAVNKDGRPVRLPAALVSLLTAS